MLEHSSTIAHERSIDRWDEEVESFVEDCTVVDMIPNDVGSKEGEEWLAGDSITILEQL
jgi:hypothetical protein